MSDEIEYFIECPNCGRVPQGSPNLVFCCPKCNELYCTSCNVSQNWHNYCPHCKRQVDIPRTVGYVKPK